VVLSRGVWRIFAVALTTYERTLEAHALVDFSGVLQRALDLLRQMDEFARSRYRLEARYHHVLVDEFQDTSRAQWELVAQLVRSWGEGWGASAGAIPPSIFVVGDRKQSIYGFRDTEVAVMDDAAEFIRSLRPAQEISRLLTSTTIRDRHTGVRRPARPADVGILFRSRESHRDFERALERRGVPTYVYRGLGFFDAPEVQDAVALLSYLAQPTAD